MNSNNLKLEDHMRFICPECGVELESQIVWRKHLISTHDYNKKTVEVFNFKKINERYHECNECHKWVGNGSQSITALQYHRISHLPFNLTFKCRYCVKAFARKRALYDHLLSDHQKFLYAGQNKKVGAGWTQVPAAVTVPTLAVHSSMSASVTKVPPSMSNVGNLEDTILHGIEKIRKDPGDLIQKALLDSLIDLENENLTEFTKSNSDINEYALNQSLNDLEAILKGDLMNSGNDCITVERYVQPTVVEQYSTETINTNILEVSDLSDVEDNELEQICADIFEEISEPIIQDANAENNVQVDQEINSTGSKSETTAEAEFVENEKDLTDTEEPDEKIISIEINTVNEKERDEMFTSPKRKRLKIEIDSSNSEEISAKMKLLLETYILYLCPECGREFKTQSAWKDHVFRVHDLNNTIHAKFRAIVDHTEYKCLDCGEVLRTTKIHDLQRHRFTHMPFQSYLKCTFCNKTKSSKPKILQHLQSCHAPCVQKIEPIHQTTINSLKCPKCYKTFQSKLRLQGHCSSCIGKAPTVFKTSTKNCNDSSISSNLNLIAHLKKMRARMRSLLSAENAPAPTTTKTATKT